VPDVVDHPDRNATRGCSLDRASDDLGGLGREVEVVLGEIEGLPGTAEVVRDQLRDLGRLLSAVGEDANGEGLGAQRTLTRPPNWRQRPAWKRSIRVRSTG
jgi:hypothetical protein